MNYKYIRKAYEELDYGNKQELWKQDSVMECAKRIASEMNEIVQEGVFVTLKKVDAKSFVKLQKYLEGFQLFRVDKNGQILEQETLYVNKKLNPSDTCNFTKEETLYFCWVLKEAGLHEGATADLYEEWMEILGQEYSPHLFSNVEDVILSLVFQTGYGFEAYQYMLQDWIHKEKDVKGSLCLPYAESAKDLTFALWKQTVEAGMEEVENVYQTRVSMETLGSEFNSVLRSRSFNGKQGLHDVFTESFCEKIVNTETRRKFYFFRILLRIMEKQKEDILQALEEYCKGQSKVGTKKVEELVANCWFEKVKETGNYSDIPWSKIAEGPRKVIRLADEPWMEGKITLEQVREDFDNSKIRPSSIARAFNDAFSVHGYAFEKASDDEDQGTGRNVGPHIQKLLMKPNQKISRETLLLSVLLARANGIDSHMDLDYVKEHILYNSRYLKKLDVKNNEIDGYFVYLMEEFDDILCQEERMKLLKNVSEDLRWELSENVFHDILYNKGVKLL